MPIIAILRTFAHELFTHVFGDDHLVLDYSVDYRMWDFAKKEREEWKKKYVGGKWNDNILKTDYPNIWAIRHSVTNTPEDNNKGFLADEYLKIDSDAISKSALITDLQKKWQIYREVVGSYPYLVISGEDATYVSLEKHKRAVEKLKKQLNN